ncbi:hypothetical protein [Rhizobium leguminosarum]
MPSFSLPWVVGPVPIVVTTWSAYVTTTAVIHRKEMTGGRFVAAFLFPLGLIAATSLIFLPRYDVRIVLTAGQVATTVCFIAIYILEKTLRGDPPLALTERVTLNKILWSLYFAAIIYFMYCFVMFNFPIFNACSIEKCYALELLLGGKVYKFSVLYSLNFFGSLMLAGIILILFLIISKVQTKN